MTLATYTSSKNPPNIVIEVENLYKRFGRFEVHRGINLKIRSGTITYIMGGSGVGKSVLIKQIMGFIRPDKGTIRVNGHFIHNATEKRVKILRRNMGILFQNGALFDSLDVYENVAFALKEQLQLDKSEIDQRVQELLESVDLTFAHGGMMPAELSGGQRKRVALARAIAMKPSIIMFDEPTTGLDPLTTEMVTELIRETNRKHNLTTLVISHDTNVALDVAEEIVFLKDGVVQYCGSPQGVFDSPNKDVQRFFASEAKKKGI